MCEISNNHEVQRREAQRIQTQLPVIVGERVGCTYDVSATGMCIELGETQELGSTMEFWLSLDTPGGSLQISCKGEVVRVENAGKLHKIAVRILSQEIMNLDKSTNNQVISKVAP